VFDSFPNISLARWRFEMRAMHATAIALSLTVALTGTALASDASIRAFHASPDAPAVDVLVNNALSPIAGLSYGNVSSYVDVPGATYNFKIVSAGANAPIVFDGDLAADTDYTIAATGLLGGSPAFAPIVLTDDNTLSATSARLRFVHASANAPAVDIALAGGDVLFSNISVRDYGGYINVPGGTYTSKSASRAPKPSFCPCPASASPTIRSTPPGPSALSATRQLR